MNPFTIITGASSGIGYELAHVFAEKKHNLILVARSEEKLKNLQSLLQSKHQVQVEVIVTDLCSPQAAQTIFRQIKSLNITVNGLINNAGFGEVTYFHQSSLEHTKDMIQVNVMALVELCRLFAPEFTEYAQSQLSVNLQSQSFAGVQPQASVSSQAHDSSIASETQSSQNSFLKNNFRLPFIINVASTGSFTAGPLIAVYYASKAFVLSFTEALAEELKNHSVFVCALCPGSTVTGFQEKAHFSLQKKKSGYGLQLFGPASARSVAEYAYKCLETKQVVAIHGFINRLFIFSTRLLPRFLVRKLMMKAQLKRATNIRP